MEITDPRVMKSAHLIIWQGSLLPVAAERFLFNQMCVSDQLIQYLNSYFGGFLLDVRACF